MTAMLRQLPKSGDWIDPRLIVQVEANGKERRTACTVRYETEHAVGGYVDCDTYEEACTIRDEIAAMVNAADSEKE